LEPDEFAAAFDGRTERSGTFNIASFDEEFYRKVIGFIPPPPGPLPLYTISVTYRDPVPCPSPWRHPLRWLRWNPFLLSPPYTISFKNATLELKSVRVR
jgi:hypothetical protein